MLVHDVLANGVGTNFGVGGWRGEARAESGDGVLGEGVASPPHQLGGLRDRCKLPSGFRAEPQPPKGFFVSCAVRLPFPASQYVLHTVCMGRY